MHENAQNSFCSALTVFGAVLEVPGAFDSHTEVYSTPEPCNVFIF